MIEIVSEFVVKEEARRQFELTFGPGGAWSKLFASCQGFRGTTLFRDTNNPRRYLTIDLWETVTQREQSLVERKTEYADLETAFADWTESRIELGIFRSLAEGTVRPPGKSPRSKAGVTRRRSHSTTR